MRQYAGYATAAESNRRYRYLLAQGTTGLSVAFDLPTQIGLDSNHPLSQGEVGRVGVAIDTIDDMEELLDGIPLDEVSCSMTINSTAAILLAFYLAVARRRGFQWKDLRGTVQNDILKEYIARGTYIYPPRQSMRVVTDIFSFCSEEVPRWNTISISGYHIREAGSTAVQELAFTMANGETYVEAALASGLKVDDFAPRLSFFFNAHSDLLEEVAKFRAARRMWARMMRTKFKAKDRRSWMLRFHTQTAGSTLTSEQPENNITRVAYQALAAVLGGTQSLHTNAMDEALALPTEESARTALRTQQVIAHESGVPNVADPLGGSWCVESLTDDLEAAAETYLESIRGLGGMLKAIELGFVQAEINQAAYKEQMDFESGGRVVVGVNRYAEDTEEHLETLKIDPRIEESQIELLETRKLKRNSDHVITTLEQIRRAAAGTSNLLPHIIEAVEGGATVGEISAALREVFGEYQDTAVY
jgi:methylmalonyl-CoA mutase N-terminal domain/subunit